MQKNTSRLAKVAKASVGLAACVAATISAYAIVTFDPATGLGFVGKGDVQLAFGWNNATLQTNASGVTFSYITSADYEVVCEWDTEQGGKNQETTYKHHIAKQDLTSSIAYDPKSSSRKNPQGDVTGFNLTGLGTVTQSGDAVPQVGDACLGNGQGTIDPKITAVTEVGGGTTGGLYANFGGTSVLLNWPILP